MFDGLYDYEQSLSCNVVYLYFISKTNARDICSPQLQGRPASIIISK